MSEASMQLIKGAKKMSLDADLGADATPKTPEPAAADEGIDVAKMTVAQIDQLVKDANLEVPDTWSKMTKTAKVTYLEEKYGEEKPDAPASDGPVEPVAAEQQVEPGSSDEADFGATHAIAKEKAAAEGTVAEFAAQTNAEAFVDKVIAEETTAAEQPSAVKEDAEFEVMAEQKAAIEAKATKSVTKVKAAKQGVILPADDLTSAVKFIENLKEEEAKSFALTLNENASFEQFRMGGVLAMISAHQWYKPFATFKEYVEIELGMAYRKCAYLVEIYNKVTDSDIPYEKIKGIGWTKLKEIVSVLTKDNVDHWVSVASNCTTLQLQELVKQHKAGANTSLPPDTAPKTTTSIKFSPHPDQVPIIEAALEKSKGVSGTTNNTVAFENICGDYLAGGALPIHEQLMKIGLEAAIKALDKAFPDVNITVAEKV